MPQVNTRKNADGSRSYYVRLRDPRRQNKQTSATFYTKPEAEKFCRVVDVLGPARALDDLDRDLDVANEPTLDDWAARHFAALTGITDGTRVSYQRIYARTWQPPLGAMRLSTITREDVGAAVNHLTSSDKTVRNAWGVLAGIMKAATRARLVTDNPCDGVRLPRRTEHERVEHRYLTVADFHTLIEATPGHWRPLVWMLAGTGMRWGELEALNVGDVDLADQRLGPVVRIAKSVKWDPSKAVRDVGPTKTRKSRRTVTLPNEVVEQLRPLIDRPRGHRLFLPPRGGPLRHKTFYTDIWVRAAGVVPEPRPRIHDLRHTHVAWLIAAGVPLPVIQARLGHEKITTTIDTYGHLLPDLQAAAADAWSKMLNPPPAQPPELPS